MNIDEKLAALTQSVELLATMHRDNEQRIVQLAERNARLEGLVTEIAEGTARLLRVVEFHEQRISDLEGNRPQ
jgi:hypothetical protein